MKKKKDNVIKITKDELVKNLGVFNYRLDLIRNGIFNISLSLRYLGSADLDITNTDMTNLSNKVNDLQAFVNELVNKLNMKIGDLRYNNEKKA